MVVTLRIGERIVEATVDASGRVTIDNQTFTVTPRDRGLFAVSNDEAAWNVAVEGPPDQRWVGVGGAVAIVEVTTGRSAARPRRRAGSDVMAAPMPATVVSIEVAPAQSVTRGETVVLLEAMKMELPVRAPRDGVVRAVN